MSEGNHEGEEVSILGGGTVLNRYGVSWQVSAVEDPRGGSLLCARRVRVMVVPLGPDGTANPRVRLNKVVQVSTVIFSGAPQ